MDHFPIPLCYEQDQLAKICPDRDLKTPEFHTPNDYYGQASVLKRYAGLPDNTCLKAVLEHGLILDERIWDYDRDQQLPWFFASSESRAVQLKQLTQKVIEPIGFGFLYARQLVDDTAPAVDESTRRGTLIFPCHSTHTVTSIYDHEDYAERILRLPAAVQPACVCLYWRNFEFGHHELYQRRGIPVFSAGHMFDPDFLLRSYDLLRRFRYAASNVYGTHYFQAIGAGCGFFFLPSGDISWDVPDVKVEGEARGTLLGEFADRIHDSSHKPWDQIDVSAQRTIAAEVLGEASLKTPEQLRELFDQAAWADRFSPSQIELGGVSVPALPWQMRRRMRFVGRIKRSIAKRLPWRKAA